MRMSFIMKLTRPLSKLTIFETDAFETSPFFIFAHELRMLCCSGERRSGGLAGSGDVGVGLLDLVMSE